MKNKTLNIIFLCLVEYCLFISCTKPDESDVINMSNFHTISNITDTSVTINSKFIAHNLISYGHCWAIQYEPTINDFRTTFTQTTSQTVDFTSQINGLTPGTEYFARSYVTTTTDTAYGIELRFVTKIADIDDNLYKIVLIGDQEWLKENLKTTKLNDGSPILLVNENNSWSSLVTPGYCFYENDKDKYNDPYGALYNWYAVNSDKLCPAGWHVPSIDEWTTLTDYLGGEDIAGGKMKEIGITHWLSPNTRASDKYNFTGLPGGFRAKDGSYSSLGNIGGVWSSTDSSAVNAYNLNMYYNSSDVKNFSYEKSYGFSVRCVKNK